MITCYDVAQYFLSQVDEDTGDSISNLKLQKLVYYAQGYHLAMYDRKLFYEPIVKWEHGPVVPDLYHHFKQNGAESIPPEFPDLQKFTVEEIELLNYIWEMFGQFSAGKLRNMTHEELPYKKTVKGEVMNTELMKEYFRTQLAEAETN